MPEFFRAFSVTKKVKRARLYATALGVYDVHINGQRVGDLYDAPFWTSYTQRVEYQTYDVTELLKEQNGICAHVGEGWYKGKLGWENKGSIFGDETAFCADLILTYEDGSEEIIATDLQWRCRPSEILSSSLYDGDAIDTRFKSEQDYAVKEVSYAGKIVGQINEPVRVIEVLPAKETFITPKGERVIDFGQNATGIVRFRVKGRKGQVVKISHAEMLDEQGNFYTANLRQAKCEDTFILNGKEQTLQPIFTFHAFRYVRVEGMEEINLSDFELLVLHSDMKRTGSFECSDPSITRLYSNLCWSQRDNFFDVPTDCPQRDERLGWTGDAHVFCRTASFNYNVVPFFAKWLGDLALEQENGKVPHVVPNILGNYLTPSSCWGDSATVIPWTLYRVYGDMRILERQYDSMKAWVEYIRSQSPNFLWQSGFQYGDWLALDKEEFSDRTGATDKYLIATAYYAYSTDIVAKTAKLLGNKAEAEEYRLLYKNIVSAFRKEYVTRTGRLVSETQTACVLALYFDLLPKKFRAGVLNRLAENIQEHRGHLTTGFVGTPYLMLTLSENGRDDIAEELLFKSDYPSWLYEIERGATTIWERWNAIQPDGSYFEPSMSSFNHYAYGSVGEWMFRKLVGIDCIKEGYREILIKPRMPEKLQWCNASYECLYGTVAVSCRREKSKTVYQITIPANTRARVELPSIEPKTVGSGTYEYEVTDHE